MNDRALWDYTALQEYTRLKRSRVEKLVSQPGFPPAVRLWEGAHPRWVAREVMDYVEAQRA